MKFAYKKVNSAIEKSKENKEKLAFNFKADYMEKISSYYYYSKLIKTN